MYDVKKLWKELKMEVDEVNKPTPKQQSIFEFCSKYSGITPLNDIYKKYKQVTSCNRDYFFNVVSTRWSVFREDSRVWVDFDSPQDELWLSLEQTL